MHRPGSDYLSKAIRGYGTGSLFMPVVRSRVRSVALAAACFAIAAVCAVYAVSAASSRPVGAAGDCTTDPTIDSEEQAFLTLINNYRAENGRGPLALSYTLSKAAQWKSQDMGANAYFAHDDLSRSWIQRIRDCGYSYNTYIGENIAAGYQSAASVFEGWRNSPGHNSNMLGSNYTAIGIGRANVPGSPYGIYWTTEFGGVVDPFPGSPSATPTRTRTPTPTSTRTNTPVVATATRTNTPTATATAAPDTTDPTASISSPSSTGTLQSWVPFVAEASDGGSGVQKVRFWIDGTYLGYDSVAPYSRMLPTQTYSNGRHTLKIEALDNALNSTITTLIVTIVNPDSTPPTVSVSSPANGATVSGTITITAAASDTQGLQKVRFWVDGTYLGYDSAAPYARILDASSLSPGPHTITAQAVDWGNNLTDTSITVNVGP